MRQQDPALRSGRSRTGQPAGHNFWKMAAQVQILVAVCLLVLSNVEATPDTLSALDSSFCHGGLEVIYPGLDIDRCLIIPQEQKLREKVSKVWEAPKVYFTGAQEEKTYVLVMVDPDAPSRTNPTSGFWRHWLVVDIQGAALNNGQTQGTTLTDYHPPTPPQASGFHRYQFMLFEQPPNARVSLTEQEASRGKWDLQAFISKSNLGEPVATLQFLTQNYRD